MGTWRPHTRSYRISDFGVDAPDWAVEQRQRQAEQIAELRRERGRRATKELAAFAGKHLEGAGPWPFEASYSAWREHASATLEDWAGGYKFRWFAAGLAQLGYGMTGRRRTVRERLIVNGVPARDKATTLPIYTSYQADGRQIVRLG